MGLALSKHVVNGLAVHGSRLVRKYCKVINAQYFRKQGKRLSENKQKMYQPIEYVYALFSFIFQLVNSRQQNGMKGVKKNTNCSVKKNTILGNKFTQ